MASLARILTPAERSVLSDLEGFDFYSYLEITDADGTWQNVGKLAVGSSTGDFFNTCQLADGIDQNTPSFTAVLAREIGVNYSLSPYRSNSALNARANGTFGPILDIRRYWRLWAVAMPHGIRPSATSFRVWKDGRLDVVDVQEKPSTVTIIGRGMEADLIDSYVSVTNRTYGDTTTPVDVEDVIQAMLDDQMGIGRVSLYAPEAPVGLQFPTFNQDEGALMPQIVSLAALAATVTRYRYDSSDVNRFTQFTPQRNPDPSAPDWIVGPKEWTGRPVSRIDVSPVRNFIIVRYPDATFNSVQEVISPAAEPSTVTVAGETATFSASPGAAIADGAIIVINRVAFTVSDYDDVAGTATLAGAPDVAGADWHTSASITRYGLRPLLIDLTIKEQITDQTRAGAYADAIRSDSEDPGLEQQIELRGWWFLELWDYLKLLPDGLVQNEDVFGAVAGYTMTLQNSTLIVLASLRGKPAGGYRRWLSLGSGAPRAALLPELTASGVFVDGTNYTTDVPQVQLTVVMGDRCNSAKISWFTDEALTIPWRSPAAFDRIITGNPVTYPWGLADDTERNKTYYAQVVPYSGPVIPGPGPSGITGNPVVVPVYAGTQMTPQASFDVLQGDVTTISGDVAALIDEPITTHGPSSILTNPRRWTDRPNAAIDLAIPGEIGIDVSSLASGISTVSGTSGRVVFLARSASDPIRWSTIPTAVTEISAAMRRRASLAGATSGRIVATILSAAPAGTKLVLSWASPGGAFADIATELTLSTAGAVASAYFAVPGGMAADVVLTVKLKGGADVASVDVSYLAFEYAVTTYTTPIPSIPEGGFDPPDGALTMPPWEYYQPLFCGITAAKVSGQLQVHSNCGNGLTTPRGVWVPIADTDGVWETKCDMLVVEGLWNEQIHIAIGSSVTGAGLAFGPGGTFSGPGGSFDYRMTLWKFDGTFFYRGGPPNLPDLSMYLRVERVGDALRFFWSEDGVSWTLELTCSIATDLGGAVPNRIGVGSIQHISSTGTWTTGVFDYLVQVS